MAGFTLDLEAELVSPFGVPRQGSTGRSPLVYDAGLIAANGTSVSAGSITVPARATYCEIMGWGAGGAGGFTSGNGVGGAGGGGSAVCRSGFRVVPGDTISYSLAGAAIGPSNAAAQANGGMTTVTCKGVTVLAVDGGKGGLGTAPGAGGRAASSIFSIEGRDGAPGAVARTGGLPGVGPSNASPQMPSTAGAPVSGGGATIGVNGAGGVGSSSSADTGYQSGTGGIIVRFFES